MTSEPTPPCVIVRAVNFAYEKHANQVRKNGSGPYIAHPLRVADILANEALVEDGITLVAAILHDTLEDTETTRDEIANCFNEEVAKIVCEVTDDKSLPKDERKRLQVAKASEKSYPAKLVKLADKLDNCREMLRRPPTNWTKERIRGYFVWTKRVLEGLRGTSIRLERDLEELLEKSKFPLPGTSAETTIYCQCLPPEDGEAECLENYYKEMAQTRD